MPLSDITPEPNPLEKPLAASIILTIAQSDRSRLGVTMQRAGCRDLTEMIRRALAFYSLGVEHNCEGGDIVFRHKGGARDGREEVLKLVP